MNPPGTFKNGERIREYSSKDLPRLSGRLLPEFSNRQSIRDMFSRRPTATQNPPSTSPSNSLTQQDQSPSDAGNNSTSKSPKRKQNSSSATRPPPKRMRPELKHTPSSESGQSTIQKYFGAKSTRVTTTKEVQDPTPTPSVSEFTATVPSSGESCNPDMQSQSVADASARTLGSPETQDNLDGSMEVNDPVANKESWSKLFRKKRPPNCEGHDEACISYVTKKPGINHGRSFWLCARPLGPSGQKEVGTNWRCSTFIWSSDWNG